MIFTPSNITHETTVSVIIATYNRAHYLPEAIDSILNQTRPPEEIIVVDDGSTDHTAEVVARYGGSIRSFRIGNGGKAAALNFGISLAQGTHIWLFDDDDLALPDALRSHVDFLAAHPEADFSYSTNYRYSGNGDIWQRTCWVSKTIPDWPPDTFLVRSMQDMHTLLQGMLIPKRCFLEVGPFDESLLRAQDVEMLIRLAYRFRGRNIQIPTFVLRDHTGPRGPGTERHSRIQRAAIQVQYQQQVFRKVRNEYPLLAYLPREPGTTRPALSEAERGQAQLQRGCILLRQGLVDEALEDLAAGLNHLKLVGSSKDWMGLILTEATDLDPLRLRRPFHLVFRLSKILKINDADILVFSIAQGVWWSFRRSVRQHLWREAAVLTGMLLLIMLCNPGQVLKHRGNLNQMKHNR